MVSRLKKIIASTSLVSGLVGGSLALTGQYFLTNNQKTQIIEVSQQKEKENVIVKPIKKEPYFRNCNNYWVSFGDDFAPGMRAYLIEEVTHKQIELRCMIADLDRAIFEIPMKFLKNKSTFSVYAIDRDNNKSKNEEAYIIDNVLIAGKDLPTSSN